MGPIVVFMPAYILFKFPVFATVLIFSHSADYVLVWQFFEQDFETAAID